MTLPHLDALYGFALSRVRDPQAAKDIVQETCLKAFRGFDRFERGTNYRGWLFRILINSVLDWRRRAARAAPLVALDDAGFLARQRIEIVAETPVDPEQNFLTKAVAAEVEAAITALSPEWHAVIHLSFVEGFSYKQIGEILGCPIGTVMSRLYRARQALRFRLTSVVGDQGASGSRADTVRSMDMLRARMRDRLRLKDA